MKKIVACLALMTSALLAADRPVNVLFICIDDLRPVLGCYGGAAKTPNIDRLASESAVFQRHYVQFPSCGPSRASMLSGRRPDSLGVYGNSGTDAATNDSAKPTLPLLFKQNGYTTLSFGKVYHSKGNAPGCGWSEEAWHPPSWDCYVNFSEKERKKQDLGDWRPAMEIYDGADSLHGDYQTADQVITALETHRDGPFFIAAGFYKPHLPFVAPKRFWDLYRDDEIELLSPPHRADGASDLGYAFNELASYGREDHTMFSSENPPTEAEARALIHAYYAAVSFTDSHVGRLLDKLDELGLRDSTAVVLWADHGFHLGDQARWAKWTQFEADMRSPFMIRLPGKSVPVRACDALVESVDVYPTVAAIAGLPLPAHLEGVSLLPLLKGDVATVKDHARSQVVGLQTSKAFMAYSVRTATHRYVEWRDRTQANKLVHRGLYDLSELPHEMKNIADDPAQQTIIDKHHEFIENGYASLQGLKPERPEGKPSRKERRVMREAAETK